MITPLFAISQQGEAGNIFKIFTDMIDLEYEEPIEAIDLLRVRTIEGTTDDVINSILTILRRRFGEEFPGERFDYQGEEYKESEEGWDEDEDEEEEEDDDEASTEMASAEGMPRLPEGWTPFGEDEALVEDDDDDEEVDDEDEDEASEEEDSWDEWDEDEQDAGEDDLLG